LYPYNFLPLAFQRHIFLVFQASYKLSDDQGGGRVPEIRHVCPTWGTKWFIGPRGTTPFIGVKSDPSTLGYYPYLKGGYPHFHKFGFTDNDRPREISLQLDTLPLSHINV